MLCSLRQAARRFTPQEVYAFAVPLLQALAYAHKKDLIHRDINPHNILLNEDGSPVLSDFGLVKILPKNLNSARPKGPASVPMGTARYMAPEHWRHQTSSQSDLYRVGVVLYEMLSEPLQDPLSREAGQPHSLRTINPDVSRGLEFAIFKALQSETSQRYQSAVEFLNALEVVKELERVSSDPREQVITNRLPLAGPNFDSARQSNKLLSKLSVLLITVLLLALSSMWMVRGAVDKQPLFFPQWSSTSLNPTSCSQTITSLSDDGGPGTFRKALSNTIRRQTCTLLFTVSGTLTLTHPLSISQNLTISAPSQQRQSGQTGQPNYNQITIMPHDPSVGITIGIGSTVYFQNISFRGLGQTQFPRSNAFVQITSADVACLYCDFSDFYSNADGSAISNIYGNIMLEQTTFEHNTSTDNGGALYNEGSISTGQGKQTMTNCIFSENTASYGGGGIYNLGGRIQVNGGSLSNNSTKYNDDEMEGGGAIASWDGELTIQRARSLTTRLPNREVASSSLAQKLKFLMLRF